MESFMNSVDYYRTVPFSLWFASSSTVMEKAKSEISEKINNLEFERHLNNIREKNTIALIARRVKEGNSTCQPPDKKTIFKLAKQLHKIEQENLRIDSIIEGYKNTYNTLEKHEYQDTVVNTMKHMIYVNAKRGITTEKMDNLTEKFDRAIDDLNCICDAFSTSTNMSGNFHEPRPLITEEETEKYLSKIYAVIGEEPKYKIYNDNLTGKIALSLKEPPSLKLS